MDDKTLLLILYKNMYQFMIRKDTDNLAKILSDEFNMHHKIENARSSEIVLAEKEVSEIDSLLDSIGMS